MLYQNSSVVVFTLHILDSSAAPESSTISFQLKSSQVKVQWASRNWNEEVALESSMPVHLKSSLVKEELTATAWERDAAPESPMLFPLKFSLVKEELSARSSRC